MITIASNYTAADDDARESLKASAIQNTGEQPTWSGTRFQQRPAMELPSFRYGAAAPMSYDEYRDMPCFAHWDASGKCNHTNRNCKFVNDIKADQEAGCKCTRRE
jgi:hypothetical protein